ncbi:hypothetical protein LGK95_09470 [Clostridium algoriphilum]|uniref:hypothetical protein n=1 Tax=Clostridium algoriphilum TaxID=198347 RepID=UPI001CF5C208|nr:hypothetical protein [Clostridium algoriphilum]MCB2293753.1 hypothetical protein [Clostridium algoriphilum]
MMDREQASKENRRDYIKKGNRTQNGVSKNQIIQTIEESAYNDSVLKTNKSEYYGTKSE